MIEVATKRKSQNPANQFLLWQTDLSFCRNLLAEL